MELGQRRLEAEIEGALAASVAMGTARVKVPSSTPVDGRQPAEGWERMVRIRA
jgi:hypothetical protein